MAYKPLFVTPLFGRWDGADINDIVNTTLICSLPEDCFSSAVLASKYSEIESRGRITIVRPSENVISKNLLIRFPWLFRGDVQMRPDAFNLFWTKAAIRSGLKYIQSHKVDYIHTISIPYSSHLVGLKLKELTGLPWIAHFYEPWSDNPFRIMKPESHAVNTAWEAEVSSKADILIHNSRQMCDSWIDRYGQPIIDKLYDLPLCMKVPGLPSQSLPHSKITFSHIGNLYGLRNAGAVTDAVSLFANKYPELRNSVRFLFVGETSPQDKEAVHEKGLEDIVEFTGRLSESECIRYYNETDVFIVIESELQGKLFFPSKLIRYYGYDKPVVGFSPNGSVLDSNLKQNGHCCFQPSDIEGFAEYIHQAVVDYPSLQHYNHAAASTFSPEVVAGKYLNIVEKLL